MIKGNSNTLYTVMIDIDNETITAQNVKEINHTEPAVLGLIYDNEDVQIFNFNKIIKYTIVKQEG